MTDKELEKLGIYKASRMNRSYVVLDLNISFRLSDKPTIGDVFEAISRQEYVRGVEAGHQEKVNQLRKLLGFENQEN